MRKLLFLAVLVFGFLFLGPELLEAQGVGLRCDTPHCRYAPIYRGRWAGDGRHDYSPYGYGYGASITPFGSGYSHDSMTIVNPAPGTNLSVKQEGGGFFCGTMFSIGCSKKDVNFSTAAPKGYEPVSPSYAQPAQQRASSNKHEQKLACETTCVRVSGGSSEVSMVVKGELIKRSYTLTTKDELDYELRIADEMTGDKITVKLELLDRNGNRVADSAGSARFRAEGEDTDARRAATILAAIEAMKALKF